jgi:SPP1 gp7 family putative phage head morphogenesis protein
MAKKNPKLPKIPTTVNELIADRAIRHSMYLERYKTQVVYDLIKELNKRLEPKLVAQIEKNLRQIIDRNRQLTELFKYNGELTREEYKYILGKLNDHLRDFSDVEANWMAKTMTNTMPIAFDFLLPSAALIKNIVEKQPMDGVLVKDWFAKLAGDTAFKVNRQIQLGMINGEGIEEIVRRIKGTRVAQYSDGILEASRSDLRAVVRSSVSNISNLTRQELYQANSDIIKGVGYIATLDPRTCEVCAANEENSPYDIDNVPSLPVHWNCRCSTYPITKSWKEFGIDLSEAPEGTRASMNGQAPASLKYSEWLQNQSAEVQNDALGVGKAKLFRSNELNIKDFIDRQDKVLTLAELKEKFE